MRTSNQGIHLPFYTVETLKRRLEWIINLRWVAVFGILVAVPIGQQMLGFSLGYPEILVTAAVLLVANLIFFFVLHFTVFRSEFEELIFAEVMVILDLVVISCLVHFLGGVDNPFYFFYLIVVILSVFLFPGIQIPLVNAFFAASLLTLWTILEKTGHVRAYSLGQTFPDWSHVLTALLAFYIMAFTGVALIYSFVRSHRALQEVIDEKNRELERAMQERTEIFRYASHELKSPITTIQSTLAVVNTTLSHELSPQVMDMVSRAERRASQLLEMVNEMIEITKYKQGIKVHNYQCVQFSAWLKRIAETQSSFAIQKQIDFQVFPLEREITICFDRNEMDKVVINLVSNALRYTPSGGRVWITPFHTETHYGFTVADTGIGIAPEDQKRIFQEFYRTPEARKIEKTGTGLGLNLVKEIVEKHGGTITVESTPGQGSRFTVTLPRM